MGARRVFALLRKRRTEPMQQMDSSDVQKRHDCMLAMDIFRDLGAGDHERVRAAD